MKDTMQIQTESKVCAPPPQPDRPSRWLTVARVVLAMVFVISGANGLFPFMPNPPVSGPAAGLMTALASTGYFFPLLRGMELGLGMLLLLGRPGARWMPVTLALLAPIIVNVIAFHLFLAPAGLPIAVVLLATYLPLLRQEWPAFAHLRRRLRPGVGGYLFGGLLVVSGLSGLVGLTPPPSTPWAAGFIQALTETGYLVPMISLVQLAAGVLMLVGRVPLGLVVFTPLLVHIVGYRLLSAQATPRMLVVTVVLVLTTAAIAWVNRTAWIAFAGWRSRPQPRLAG